MKIAVNGVRLFFDVEGANLVPDGATLRERPTLILLHGGPGFDHSGFKPAFSQLTDVCQIIYLDHRGQGRSDRSEPAHWNLDQWADDLYAFCEALGIHRPIVMGNSFGGMVAMAYAHRYPDQPGRLILSSTSARQNLRRTLDRFGEIGGADVAAVARSFWENPSPETLAPYTNSALPTYNRRPGDPEAAERTRWALDVLFHFAGDEIRRMNLLPGLAGVRCPTLVMGGEQDPVCPIEDQVEIVGALPSQWVVFKRFDDCGHGPFRDQPESTFRAIREFISQTE